MGLDGVTSLASFRASTFLLDTVLRTASEVRGVSRDIRHVNALVIGWGMLKTQCRGWSGG